MTDEQIIALAEKKYKDKPQESCVFCDDCPMFICANSKGCVLTAYKQGFLDGFKAAMEYFNQIIKKLNTDDKFDDDFNYYGGYKRAFNDIQEELGMHYDKK